jgi:hypothetical protein
MDFLRVCEPNELRQTAAGECPPLRCIEIAQEFRPLVAQAERANPRVKGNCVQDTMLIVQDRYAQ